MDILSSKIAHDSRIANQSSLPSSEISTHAQFCISCGSAIVAEAKFCHMCGQKIKNVTTKSENNSKQSLNNMLERVMDNKSKSETDEIKLSGDVRQRAIKESRIDLIKTVIGGL